MKISWILPLLALVFCFEARTRAEAPTDVGDSFISLGQAYHGMGSNRVFYLGKDGSCKLLSQQNLNGPGAAPSFQPSGATTYTYVRTPGNPNEATLTFGFGGNAILEFTDSTSGYQPFGTEAFFYFLLPSQNTFLTNVSNRVTLHPSEPGITGFVVGGDSDRLVLIRTVGPSLAQFGVSPVSPNPKLNIFSGVGTDQIGSGRPWGSLPNYDAQAMGWIFEIAGAFGLQTGSADVVSFGVLSPGTYTAQASDASAGASGGSALTEVYILPYSGSTRKTFGF
jgi:hypothetical protein